MSQLDAALAMAKRGFRVFPLRVYGKRPAISAFQNAATCDENIIRAWWNDNPKYNIGILTTGLVVVDIDVKYVKDAVDEYTKNGGHFDTFVVKTPTGGYHCYFNGPDAKLAAGVFPGVDLRAYNGYVVGPGSTVDAALSGEDNIKATGTYVIAHDIGGDIGDLPWVPEGIERKLEKPGVRIRIDFSVELDTTTAILNATEWLKSADPAIEGMGGDNRTYETAAKLVRDFALSPETAFQLLWQNWNDYCIPPWPEHELWHKVENAVAYGKGPLGAARPEAYFGSVQLVPVPQLVPAIQEQDDVYMGNLMMAKDIRSRQWLVERLLLKRDITVLGGSGGAGKSIFILTVICHLACGKDFGVYKSKEKRPLRFMIYNAEDDREEQARRILAICFAFNLDYELVRSNIAAMGNAKTELLLARIITQTPMQDEKEINTIVENAKRVKADILIFDPLVNLHTCNENDNSQMRFVMSIFRRIAVETDTAVFLVHHANKGNAKENKGDPDAMRGATAIVNSARISLMISSVTDADRKEMNIGDEERYIYVRIDNAKTNIYLKTGGAIMYLMLQSIRLPTGDDMGVPVPVAAKIKTAVQRQTLAVIIVAEIRKRGKGYILLSDAAEAVQLEIEFYSKMDKDKLRRDMQKWFEKPVKVDGSDDHIVCVHDNKRLILELR